MNKRDMQQLKASIARDLAQGQGDNSATRDLLRQYCVPLNGIVSKPEPDIRPEMPVENCLVSRATVAQDDIPAWHGATVAPHATLAPHASVARGATIENDDDDIKIKNKSSSKGEESEIGGEPVENHTSAAAPREKEAANFLLVREAYEKATILHQEAHRGPDKPLPRHYSRHYYDLYRLSLLPIRDNALKKIDLLQDVVQFKMRFYRCPWARYEDAKHGSLKLLPPEHHLAELKRDYQAMQAMLFGQIPSFDEIMVQIEFLEKMINA